MQAPDDYSLCTSQGAFDTFAAIANDPFFGGIYALGVASLVCASYGHAYVAFVFIPTASTLTWSVQSEGWGRPQSAMGRAIGAVPLSLG